MPFKNGENRMDCANCQRCIEAAVKWWRLQPEETRRTNAWHLGGFLGTYLAYGGGMRTRLGLFTSGFSDLVCRAHASAALETLRALCRQELTTNAQASRRTGGTASVEEEQKHSDTLVFVTQNLWNPNYGGCGPNPVLRLKMFAAFVQAQQADVVNVQELCEGVVVDIKLDEFESSLAACELVHQASPQLERAQSPSWNFIRQRSGLALYSKFPLVSEPRWTRFVAQNTAGALSSKGFLHSILKLPRAVVHVFNVHLCNDRQDVRMQQLREMEPCIRQVMHEHVVVAGDLNICPQPVWDNGESYANVVELMSALNLVPAAHVAQQGLVSYPQDNATYDHVFYSKGKFEVLEGGAKVVDASENPADLRVSDHLAVVCKFKVQLMH